MSLSTMKTYRRSLNPLYALSVAMLFAGGAAHAQRSMEFDPALASRLQSTLESERETRGTIGISVAIISPRKGTWLGTSGISEPSIPLGPEMLLGIGSITKTFTAAAILQMVDEGKIALDDRIGRWLPPMTNIDSTITIRQLLSHTSGIYNYTNSDGFWAFTNQDLDRYITPDETLQFIGPRVFAPGASWSYSNTNYLLLGLIIETISGTDYESEIRRRFLDPLGLSRIALGTHDTLPGDAAHNWVDVTGDNVPDDLTFYPRRAIYSGAWAAGGFLATPEDMAKWARALYGGGLLSPTQLTQMTTFRTLSDGSGYGLGAMRHNVGGKSMWGHTGAIIGYRSTMLYNPQDSVAFVAIINQDGPDAENILKQIVIEYYRTSSVRDVADGVGVAMEQSSPNPFMTATTIRYRLERPADVGVRIYSATGELVRVLDQSRHGAGSHSIVWDGRNDTGDAVADGVYICRVASGLGMVAKVVVKM